MTNFEKYKDVIPKLLKVESNYYLAVKNREPVNCYGTHCSECTFSNDENRPCSLMFIEWLYEEYKEPSPKLTKRERAFCESFAFALDKYIERTNLGNLFVGFRDEPKLALDNTWFKFIKNDSKWNVADLLKLEVE